MTVGCFALVSGALDLKKAYDTAQIKPVIDVPAITQKCEASLTKEFSEKNIEEETQYLKSLTPIKKKNDGGDITITYPAVQKSTALPSITIKHAQVVNCTNNEVSAIKRKHGNLSSYWGGGVKVTAGLLLLLACHVNEQTRRERKRTEQGLPKQSVG